MSTEKELTDIIKRLKQKVADADRFNKVIKQELREIDERLEKLKRKKKG